MVIQHNLTAMNSNRMLGLTTKTQAKSTEKLSSGYKINRAADDAAGLSISEKMRKQIRGLTQASLNAQDGISAVQTAEGALTEVHDMLQRMNELAVKAGNGTMSESDRQSVQDEIDQLVTEIDRVSETTKFNETYLLKGSGKNVNAGEVSARVNGKIQDGVMTEARGNIFSATFDMADASKMDVGTDDTATIEYKDEEGNTRTKDVAFKTGSDAKSTAANLAEAINKDDTLKHIFKASSDASGKISVESKLDGTKTDDTKNAVQKITFESGSKIAAGTAKRLNKFVGIDQTTADDAAYKALRTAATGESYALEIGKGTDTTAGTAPGEGAFTLNMQDGESITINGKTYTYDAGKGTGDEANTFKTFADLQKLIGDDFKLDVQISATKVSQAYNADDTENGDAVKEAFTTTVKDLTKALAKVTDADLNDSMAGAEHTDGDDTADTEIKFTDIKVQLLITEKASAEQPSDLLNFSLQVGADTTEENKISVDIQSMSAKSLGINKVSVTGEDSTNADKAVNTIADAVSQVSKQRSALGAVQNRLEHTINNLDNVVENTTSAESQIRDTDMASEMVKYSNNNILAQAGQAMLAQANQSNQGVLSLLG